MTDLKPCPFCGGEAECHKWWSATISGDYATFCAECGCGTDYFKTEAEAIAAWNTRAEHGTLTAEQVREAIKANSWPETDGLLEFGDSSWQEIADELNARAERTCRNDKDKWSGLAKYLFVCSECGWNLADVGNDAIDISARLMKRCPMCGAKVIV